MRSFSQDGMSDSNFYQIWDAKSYAASGAAPKAVSVPVFGGKLRLRIALPLPAALVPLIPSRSWGLIGGVLQPIVDNDMLLLLDACAYNASLIVDIVNVRPLNLTRTGPVLSNLPGKSQFNMVGDSGRRGHSSEGEFVCDCCLRTHITYYS
jgi:hypothetical protein